MGKGKLAKFAYIDTLPFVLQYPRQRLLEEGFPYAGKWRSHFFDNSYPITLELGCGGGEYTVSLAKEFPQGNYIGVDRKGARIWSGAKRVEEDALANVAFLRTDISFIADFFAPGEVSAIWITFPDPMMKKAKSRLVGSLFLEKYRKILAPDGVIFLKTDSSFLYEYTVLLLETNQIKPIAATNDLYAPEEPLRNQVPYAATRYESQWLARGKTIKYIAFSLKDAPDTLIEPEHEPPHDEYKSITRFMHPTKSNPTSL